MREHKANIHKEMCKIKKVIGIVLKKSIIDQFIWAAGKKLRDYYLYLQNK